VNSTFILSPPPLKRRELIAFTQVNGNDGRELQCSRFFWRYNPRRLGRTHHWKEAAAMTTTPQEVSQLLRAWSARDQTAFDKLMPLVYEELRRMAKRHMDRQGPGHTLQTTALIHEAYLRLVDQKETRWRNRAHFFALAARAMRSILVDYARSSRGQTRRQGHCGFAGRSGGGLR
jgi:hypothetical protein